MPIAARPDSATLGRYMRCSNTISSAIKLDSMTSVAGTQSRKKPKTRQRGRNNAQIPRLHQATTARMAASVEAGLNRPVE